MMTYEQARDFLAATSKSGSVLGLESIRNLMKKLSDVQEKLPVIHLAGTNGKGSTGAFLDHILRAAGYSTARYSSPAVFDPLEVWQFQGIPISKNEYARVISEVQIACKQLVAEGKPHPTVFEVETAAAFLWFSWKKPDVVLLETGMGGSTDATNIIKAPLCSVITSISRDHMQFLGDTLTEIAEIKAGIIKKGCPVVSAPQTKEVSGVLERAALKKGSQFQAVREEELSLLSEQAGKLSFSYRGAEYRTGLAGIYQMKNAALAMEAARIVWKEKGYSEERMQAFFREGIQKAEWPGRFEVLREEPFFILDGAHNEDAAVQLAKTVELCFPGKPLTCIIGVLADKEHKRMLELMLPYADYVYTVTPQNPRALDGRELAAEVAAFGKAVQYCASVAEAVSLALQRKENVLAFGSLSYLGELHRLTDSYHEKRKLT